MQMHLIALDVPWPPNYGGVIDIYHKLRSLDRAGVKVHLHCFTKDRPEAPALDDLCASVRYYSRLPTWRSLPINKPHIVNSRRSKTLLKNLLQDEYPILFEGLHTCALLDHSKLAGRRRVVRMHNVEWDYYHRLAMQENDPLRRLYLTRESKLLREYESILQKADAVLTISPNDTEYYQAVLPQVYYLPAFHPFDQVISKPGKGDYCLYHGKLSVPENHSAAMFLVKEVFADHRLPLIIAGGDPRAELIEAINAHNHITLRANPGDAQMEELLRDAQVHMLPTAQGTGIKLKLLHSLFSGRFVLANTKMVEDTGLEPLCIRADDAEDFKRMSEELFFQSFSEMEIAQREQILGQQFDNARNVADLIRHLRL